MFHEEKWGAAALEYVMGKKVYTIPHPVDVDGIDGFKTVDRDPSIAVIAHKYRQDITTSYWATRDMPLQCRWDRPLLKHVRYGRRQTDIP